MEFSKKITRFIAWPGVILLQLIATQVVTFIISFLLGDMETFPQAHPAVFVIVLGITFSVGIFLAGWLAIKRHWLNLAPKYLARFAGALIGAYLPLILGLILNHTLEAGSPFFLISMLVSILGFYLAGWVGK